jgi:hypothetical protein
MTYNEWENKLIQKHREWQAQWEKWDRLGGFDANIIAVVEFSNMRQQDKAYEEIGREGGYEEGASIFFIESNSSYLKIHYRCPYLPVVLAICETCGGKIIRWDSSLLEYPPELPLYIPGEWGKHRKANKTSGGCYIATACYGSYDCTQILTFRNFRDEYLSQTITGRIFIKTYYTLSPSIARWLKNNHRTNTFIRKNLLDPIYDFLKKKY